MPLPSGKYSRAAPVVIEKLRSRESSVVCAFSPVRLLLNGAEKAPATDAASSKARSRALHAGAGRLRVATSRALAAATGMASPAPAIEVAPASPTTITAAVPASTTRRPDDFLI